MTRKKKPVKFCFVQDESCHWYMIPVSKLARFLHLLKDDTDGQELDAEFAKYLTGGGISHVAFENPEEFV